MSRSEYWYLLLNDEMMKKFTGRIPQITFRTSKSIRDKLVQRHYQPGDPLARTSRYCNFCPWMSETGQICLPNNDLYCPKNLATCEKEGVV